VICNYIYLVGKPILIMLQIGLEIITKPSRFVKLLFKPRLATTINTDKVGPPKYLIQIDQINIEYSLYQEPLKS